MALPVSRVFVFVMVVAVQLILLFCMGYMHTVGTSSSSGNAGLLHIFHSHLPDDALPTGGQLPSTAHTVSSKTTSLRRRQQLTPSVAVDSRVRQRPHMGAFVNTTPILEHCEYYWRPRGSYRGSVHCLKYLWQSEREYTHLDLGHSSSSRENQTEAEGNPGDSAAWIHDSGNSSSEQLESSPRNPLLIHMYWRGVFKPIMLLTIDSFLFSQPDYRSPAQQGNSLRLQPMELWIWVAHPALSTQVWAGVIFTMTQDVGVQHVAEVCC